MVNVSVAGVPRLASVNHLQTAGSCHTDGASCVSCRFLILQELAVNLGAKAVRISSGL